MTMSEQTPVSQNSGYIKKDEFIRIALACNCDKYKIVNYIVDHKIADTYDIATARQRLKAYRDKGLLPLESGNKGPEGMLIQKVATYYDKEGNKGGQWISSKQDDSRYLEALQHAVSNITDTIRPLPEIGPPTHCMADMMSVYTIGDAHVGLLAWERESGEDNDLNTAIDRHEQAMSLLVAQSNPTQEAFIIDVGELIADLK